MARAGRSLLIIEDDYDTRDMYAHALSLMGFGVVTARTGMEGFTRACESKPDVILTDLGLPTMDGWEVIRRLREDRRTSKIPIVVITGWSSPTLRETSTKLGCASLLLKPCSPNEIVAEIDRVLERADG